MSQFRAELLKLATTRTTLGLALGTIALVLLFTLLGGFVLPERELASSGQQYNLVDATTAATLFTALLGVLLVTTEYRYGTIRPTLLYEPRRERVLGAKTAAGLAVGAAFGAAAAAVGIGVALWILSARGIPRALDAGALLHAFVGTTVAAGAWCALGVGFGALVRHQVGAIVGLVAYLLVAESLLVALAPRVGRYSPGAAAQALAGEPNDQLLGTTAAAMTLTLYVIALAAAAAAAMARRDVD